MASRFPPPAARPAGNTGNVLEKVEQFVVYLYEHIREKNIPEIRSMYTRSFFRLSEMYFKDSRWPPVEEIAEFVDKDQVFCLLYQELYFRHVYARLRPTVEDRQQSWLTYCQLFDIMLHGKVTMQLPSEWLWDMVDEFMYQFQAYHQYRGKVSQHSPEEKELLQSFEHGSEKVWNIVDVMNFLQAMVDKSGVLTELEEDKGMGLVRSDGFRPNESNVLRVLGYFSLIGLLRLHALIGDYAGALQAISPINIHEPRALFARKTPGAFITLFYYAGFSYLVMKRYADATRCFNTILLYIPSAKEFQPDRQQLTQIERKEEQMSQLLAMVVAMCPLMQKQYLDERVNEGLMDHFADKVQAMRRGNMGVFDELFSAGCPRFITSHPPDYSKKGDTNQEAYQNQLRLFMDEVRQHFASPELTQYLRLYSSISLEKLATALETTEASLRVQLMCMKNKNFTRQWTAGGKDLLSGDLASTNDVDFYLDVDVNTGKEFVMICDSQHQRSHAQTILRHVHKFQDIVSDLARLPALTPAT
ncbi:hypothetical protein BSKO_07346 [Bryopsis sp. KO-2023]|nr:hypothetical protein BSKO_07346 [Bryopsis sp. KO-2023]